MVLRGDRLPPKRGCIACQLPESYLDLETYNGGGGEGKGDKKSFLLFLLPPK